MKTKRYGARGPEWARKSFVYLKVENDYVRRLMDEPRWLIQIPPGEYWNTAWCCIRAALTMAFRPSLRRRAGSK